MRDVLAAVFEGVGVVLVVGAAFVCSVVLGTAVVGVLLVALGVTIERR